MVITAALASNGCFSLFDCADEPKYTTASPSGRRTATVAIRNCGATTGITTVVTVSQKRFGLYNASRELFGADGEVAGDRYFTLRWASDDELVVTVNAPIVLFRADKPLSDLTARYEGSPKFGS